MKYFHIHNNHLENINQSPLHKIPTFYLTVYDYLTNYHINKRLSNISYLLPLNNISLILFHSNLFGKIPLIYIFVQHQLPHYFQYYFLIAKYFQEYPGIEKYMADTINFARQNLYVENLLGRRCYIPMINNKNHSLRSFAERAAINAPMQSLTADIAKMAMIAIEEKLKANLLKTTMILQIHDELLYEVKEEITEQVSVKLKEIMSQVVIKHKNKISENYKDAKINIPILVNVKSGKNWGI